MAIRIDRCRVKMSRQVNLRIEDTNAFVEDGDFLQEFYDCGLTDQDLFDLQTVLTLAAEEGQIVPVSRNIRDAFYDLDDGRSVVIRYVYLQEASTILLLTAYPGNESLSLTTEEAEEAERYIAHQMEYFSRGYTH